MYTEFVSLLNVKSTGDELLW